MGPHYTKKELYKQMEGLCHSLNVPDDSFPRNIVSICESADSITMRKLPFQTKFLRGMAVIDPLNRQDIILLSDSLTAREENFYCCHELIHLTLHRGENCKTFECFDLQAPNVNSFLEWQANEGAAEVLMPHTKVFEIVSSAKSLKKRNDIIKLRLDLAEHFGVTDAMVKVRLESLKYEISQLLAGTNIDDIEILSASGQAQNGIKVSSLCDIEATLFQDEINHFKRLRNIDVNCDI